MKSTEELLKEIEQDVNILTTSVNKNIYPIYMSKRKKDLTIIGYRIKDKYGSISVYFRNRQLKNPDSKSSKKFMGLD